MTRGSRHNIARDEWEQRRTEFVQRGQDLPHAKLLDMDVIDIRSAARQRENLRAYIRNNLSNEALAKRHGVHVRAVEKVISRETWSHLP